VRPPKSLGNVFEHVNVAFTPIDVHLARVFAPIISRLVCHESFTSMRRGSAFERCRRRVHNGRGAPCATRLPTR